MRGNDGNKHTVDMLFVLTLFCAFAVCASLLIALGAGVYKSTIDSMDEHYTLSTASAFITEKIHQHDTAGDISVVQYGDGTALRMTERYGEQIYYDYIYSYDGYIREMLVNKDTAPMPEAGDRILAVSEYNVVAPSDDIITLELLDSKGRKISTDIYIHTGLSK